MNSPDEPEEQQRQIKIDADIDEVIKTIQGLGLKPDERTTAARSRGESPSRKRNRWIRLAVITVTIFAVGAFAGFVGAYNLHAPNGACDIRAIRPWEIRRAIPMQPEIKRAIPVEPEIRKATPVHSTKRASTAGKIPPSQNRSELLQPTDCFPARGTHAREPLNGSRQRVAVQSQ